MSRKSPNRIAAACIAEALATELAAGAVRHRQEGRTETAEALLQHVRHHRVRAIRLRALAGAEHYRTISALR
ncbi:hypothetical protein MOX02_59650 [Methylobacterium oxalidis]|uniref:Uncharacterized protein n=1 Tax=Methylobacterium oxalidis TaxID=944322 RepID=A0A512JDD4_9HYPH|nr:hypothetical protein MOX02_59650 [Methylobacterium oxalidis]GLS62417.1 hypothetical protein GCM10007888_07980 [Methylobacterium oxalidis]